MDRFVNALKAHASALDRSIAAARFGTVANIDPVRYAARVLLQPDGVLSGWLPILSPWIGSGWGIATPPQTGDQVLILGVDGDAENGVILGGSYSDQQQTPGAQPGEFWVVHASGTSLKLQNDGSIQMTGPVYINDNLYVGGNIYDFRGGLDRLRQHYDAHVHPPSGTLPEPQD